MLTSTIEASGKKVSVLFLFILITLISSCGDFNNGTNITLLSNSCSFDDVFSSYSIAEAGDTISIPSGSCTWTSTLYIDKANLVFSGDGKKNTVITRNNGTVFQVNGTSGNGIRITGIGFKDCDACVVFSNKDSTKDWRIDNSQFIDSYIAVQILGTSRGLVYNNIFLNSYAFFLLADGNSSTTYPFPAGKATTPNSNIVYIEDNNFTITGDCSNVPHSIVGNQAARAVIRYNTFDYESGTCGWSDAIDAHDSLENWPDRGTLGYEIYGNRFFMDPGNSRTIHLRGGQHIVFNNYFNSNLGNPIQINNYTYSDQPGRCTGNNYDLDDPSPISCPDQINHSYFWGNKQNCGLDMNACTGGSAITTYNYYPGIVVLGTHYNDLPMSGYAGYAYPHPLR